MLMCSKGVVKRRLYSEPEWVNGMNSRPNTGNGLEEPWDVGPPSKPLPIVEEAIYNFSQELLVQSLRMFVKTYDISINKLVLASTHTYVSLVVCDIWTWF